MKEWINIQVDHEGSFDNATVPKQHRMKNEISFLNAPDQIPSLDGRTVGDFWRWAYSDVLSNRNRSIFAEFIVGVALGVVDQPRVEWDSTDLCYQEFNQEFNIEVKSSAYCQSWSQDKPSIIRFGIGKARFWNRATAKYEGDPRRCADIYVFCHYSEQDKNEVNVLNIPAWDFYVVSTDVLNSEFGEAKSVSLEAVRKVGHRCKFDKVKATVDRILTAKASEAQKKC